MIRSFQMKKIDRWLRQARSRSSAKPASVSPGSTEAMKSSVNEIIL